ncbi:hypothetical protein HK096_002139 [Nowakowskiella sp. JEL0078]|nr:hypothetical protein HK096_002139 [Nowakowskiella sp. JEL0078]
MIEAYINLNSRRLKLIAIGALVLCLLYVFTEVLFSDPSQKNVLLQVQEKSTYPTVLFFASKKADWMCSTVRSALLMNYNIEIFGWGDNSKGDKPEWTAPNTHHIGKFQGPWEFLTSLPPTDKRLFIIADAWDSIFQLPASKFLEKYNKFKEEQPNTVLISAEGKCWPFMFWNRTQPTDEKYCKPQRDVAYSRTKDKNYIFPYVNTGGTVGTAALLVPWFKIVLDIWNNEKSTIIKNGRYVEYIDDQGTAIVAFNRIKEDQAVDPNSKNPKVELDYYNNFFFNVQNSESHIYQKKEMPDRKGIDALWHTSPKDYVPAIVHTNGPAKQGFPLYENIWLKTIDKHDLEVVWDKSIGTRNFGNVPFRSLCDPSEVSDQYEKYWAQMRRLRQSRK